MSDSKLTCKCTKKIRNIEVISYTYDPKCIEKILKKRDGKSPEPSERIIGDPPRSLLGKTFCCPKALQNLFGSKCNKRGNVIDKSACELKSTVSNVHQTKDVTKNVSCSKMKGAICRESCMDNKVVKDNTVVEKICCTMRLENKNN